MSSILLALVQESPLQRSLVNDPVLRTAIYVLVIAVVAGGFALNMYVVRKRRHALARLARELGWRFRPDVDDGPFGPFGQGGRRSAYNTLAGSLVIGGKTFGIQMGDYRRSADKATSKAKITEQMSYLLATTPFPAMPDVDIRYEFDHDRMAAAVGFDDIDFESAEFSSRYHVTSSDKRFAYDLIHPRMMEFLLQVEGPTIEIRGRDVLLTEADMRWDAGGFRRKLWWVREFFELWPVHLVAQLESNE